jgi:hypothetical protein
MILDMISYRLISFSLRLPLIIRARFRRFRTKNSQVMMLGAVMYWTQTSAIITKDWKIPAKIDLKRLK